MTASSAVADEEFSQLLAEVDGDETIVGVVLGGSRGKGALVEPVSDYDVYLLVDRDADVGRCERRYGRSRGGPLEVAVLSVDGFRAHGAIGSETEWDRYTFAHVGAVVDKRGGEISRLVREKQQLTPAEGGDLARRSLDAYVNAYYRSAKNRRLGLDLESRLDAAESMPYLLTALFALHQRVRPYNKWLVWELREHPLGDAPWAADELLPRVDGIVKTGELREQQLLFRRAEQLARERGYGDVIDGWEPDVAWLRGE